MWVGLEVAGKFKVERVLGEGGMGVVLFARHVELGHPVAIKCLKREFAEHVEARGRFEREARAAAALVSDHVAHVTDVGRMPDGTPFMVMEYLEGEDLAERVEREGPLPLAFAIDCMLQACEGLAEAHEKGIVHRDVKPSNLFLARKPGGKLSLKVLDFGIAKATGHGGTELTRTSAIVGSPLYMSPEQLRESKDVDARTDVWSLGVTLFYVLTKRFPFEAEAVGEVYGKILYTEAQSLRAFAPEVPEELEALVRDCLQKEPSSRISSVAALAERLSAAQGAPASIVSSERRVATASGAYAQVSEPAARAITGGSTLAMGAPSAESPRERSGGTTLGMEAPFPADATTFDPSLASSASVAPKRRVGAVLGGLAAAGLVVGALALRGTAPGDSQGARVPASSAAVAPALVREVVPAPAVEDAKGAPTAAASPSVNASPSEPTPSRAPKRPSRGAAALAADAGASSAIPLAPSIPVLAAPPPPAPPQPPAPSEKRKRSSALEMQLE
jgi:serine/threonine protein kinase